MVVISSPAPLRLLRPHRCCRCPLLQPAVEQIVDSVSSHSHRDVDRHARHAAHKARGAAVQTCRLLLVRWCHSGARQLARAGVAVQLLAAGLSRARADRLVGAHAGRSGLRLLVLSGTADDLIRSPIYAHVPYATATVGLCVDELVLDVIWFDRVEVHLTFVYVGGCESVIDQPLIGFMDCCLLSSTYRWIKWMGWYTTGSSV